MDRDRDLASIYDDQVLREYKLIKVLGRGAYGVVWKAEDLLTGQLVAIKKCFDAFRNEVDAMRMFREFVFLCQIPRSKYIVQLIDAKMGMNNRDFYLVFEYLDCDLHTTIRSGLLVDEHAMYITYQLALAIHFIHSAGVIHRDLKPSNILVDGNATVKICDFGLCRSIPKSEQMTEDKFRSKNSLSNYVATRWYRAPEILLGATGYSQAVDVWALGCIVAEMYLKKPLFQGSSTRQQIEIIVQVLGYPEEKDIQAMRTPFARTLLQSLNVDYDKDRRTNLDQLPLSAQQFVRKCLRYNPQERPGSMDLIEDPYLRTMLNYGDIEVPKNEVSTHGIDDLQLCESSIRNLILGVMDLFHRYSGRRKGTAEGASPADSSSSSTS